MTLGRFLDELEVTPMPDGINWRINADFRYSSELLGRTITVPKRFITDFASIPQALWNVLPAWQRYGAAAVIHDFLYFAQPCARDDADLTLREAMQTLAVDDETIARIYEGVHLFGASAWEHNRALSQAGFSRMASLQPNPPYAAVL
jgi:hypothetical protein